MKEKKESIMLLEEKLEQANESLLFPRRLVCKQSKNRATILLENKISKSQYRMLYGPINVLIKILEDSDFIEYINARRF